MSKELEELKQENSYIKNKLEEIYQKQNPIIKTNTFKSVTSSVSNNNKNSTNSFQNKKQSIKHINHLKTSVHKKYNKNNIYVRNIKSNSTSHKKNNKILSISRNSTPHRSNIKDKKINLKRVGTVWRNKIPLLTSYLEENESKNKKKDVGNRNKLNNIYRLSHAHGINQSQIYTLTRPNNNSVKLLNNKNNIKVGKTEYEKFLEIKNKLVLKNNNRNIKKSESYNNINKILIDYTKSGSNIDLENELNEKNKLIKKLNHNLLEHNKITENRISLLIKDKNIINERLYMLQKEKEEYKIKKECEIKKYIQDLNINQRLIKDLNNEKERLIKSKREIEQLNQKLKNIILEEKGKRYEYEYMYKLHKLDLDSNLINSKNNLNFNSINNNMLLNSKINITDTNINNDFKNKESFMKLKYDIMTKENKEMKNQIMTLQKKLEINEKENKELSEIKEIKSGKKNSIMRKNDNLSNKKNKAKKILINNNKLDEKKEINKSNTNINSVNNNKNNLTNSNIFIYQDNEELNGGYINTNIIHSEEELKNISNSFSKELEEIEESIEVEKKNKEDNKIKDDKTIKINIDNNDINSNNNIITNNINYNNLNNTDNNNTNKSNISKKVEMIDINNEEIKLFNKHINIITENKNNQIKISEMQKEILLKNETISQLENKIQEYFKSKEELFKNLNKLQKEKDDLSKKLVIESEKTLKLKEYAEEQQKKHIKYKTKLEEYKVNLKILKEQMNKKESAKESYIMRGGSATNDNKNLLKLREDIFHLKEKLDEEKTKTEVLKLIAKNEKEKNDNYHTKFKTAKKLNGSLINKLKERDISISKAIKNESNLLKKQIVEKDKKIEELKGEIKNLNNEISTYKREIQKNNNKEKDYIKENSLLKENLSQKDSLIKISNNKLNEINLKYTEEKSKNQKLSLEIKELNLKNQRLIDERKRIPKSEKDLLAKMSNTSLKPRKSKNNKSFDLKNDEENIPDPKQYNKICKSNEIVDNNDMGKKKYESKNDEIIKELNEDNISLSESSENENMNIIEIHKKDEKENNNSNKENKNKDEESSSISEDNPDIYKEVERIMNNNQMPNETDKNNHEKTNSSFKDDKSTKMEIDKITNMQSYSET